jgi:hypothetical protein
MQMPHDDLDLEPVDTNDYSGIPISSSEDAPFQAPPARPDWRLPTRLAALARRLLHQHRRAAWQRLGFAVTLAFAVALLSACGAALLRVPQPALLGCRFGGWALALGLGVGFLLIAKSQLLQAYRISY